MAPRPFWKGYLKLSLVTCRVAMTPATSEGEKVRFHTINRATGNRVESRYVDAETGRPVKEDDEVKAYQSAADDYVVLEDEEIESVALESVRTIDIETFVPRASVPWIWYDTPHFLTPDEPVAEEAFSVIREAMAATGMVGIARLVLYRREHSIMLEPRDRGIVVWTLRYGDEVRNADDYFAAIKSAAPEAKMKALMARLIEQGTTAWDAKLVADPVQEKLLELIAAKKKPKAAKKRDEQPPKPTNVVNIMDALRKSLASEQGNSKRR